jgi:hypothetical protein
MNRALRMISPRTRRISLLLGAAMLGVWLAGCAETGAPYAIERHTVNGLPTVTATGNAKAQVTVDAIDYGNRSIALTGPNGRTEIFTVSSAVRNFGQIKRGDKVSVEYFTRMYASVRKATDTVSTTVIGAVGVAELGQKPGIVCVRQAIIEANVEAIDYPTRVVKLKTTAGDLMTLTADPKLQGLDKVNVGDQVVFDYTEAVSITVE